MPMAVLEAMEAGVPSVVTPGCYMKHAVKQGALIEVAPSPKAFANALSKLARDSNARLALGQRGQNHAWKEHSWPRITDVYTQAYTR